MNFKHKHYLNLLGGIILPIFAEPVGVAIQWLFGTKYLPVVKDDGFTYVKDEANKGTDRLQLQGVKNIFNGVDGKITIPHSDSLTFGNGTVDQPLSISLNCTLTADTRLFGKTSSTLWEYGAYVSVGKVVFLLGDGGLTNTIAVLTDVTTSIYGQSVSIFFTYNGDGTSGGMSISIYDDSQALLYSNTTTLDGGTYVAMDGDALDQHIGYREYSNLFSDNTIWNVRVHNSVLTQAQIDLLVANPNTLLGTEVAVYKMDEGAGLTSFDSVSQDNMLPLYEPDWSIGVDGWVGTEASVSAINGELTIEASGVIADHHAKKITILEVGKSYNYQFEYYIPSTATNVTGVRFYDGVFGASELVYDAWTTYTQSSVASSAQMRVYINDGAYAGTAADIVKIRNLTATENIEEGKHGTISGGVTWGTQDVVSFQNVDGYLESDGVSYYENNNDTGLIPISVKIPSLDGVNSVAYLLGGAQAPLEFTGKAPKDGKIVESIIPIFDGVADEVNFGDCGITTRVSLYVKSVIDNQYILSLDNLTTKAVYVSVGVLTFGASLTASNITIDGVVKTPTEAGVLLNDNLLHLLEFDLVSVTCTDVRLARSVANYGNIEVCKFELDELFAPMAEERGLVHYDVSGNSNDGAVTATELTYWAR